MTLVSFHIVCHYCITNKRKLFSCFHFPNYTNKQIHYAHYMAINNVKDCTDQFLLITCLIATIDSSLAQWIISCEHSTRSAWLVDQLVWIQSRMWSVNLCQCYAV